jgi:hypothetical protein
MSNLWLKVTIAVDLINPYFGVHDFWVCRRNGNNLWPTKSKAGIHPLQRLRHIPLAYFLRICAFILVLVILLLVEIHGS